MFLVMNPSANVYQVAGLERISVGAIRVQAFPKGAPIQFRVLRGACPSAWSDWTYGLVLESTLEQLRVVAPVVRASVPDYGELFIAAADLAEGRIEVNAGLLGGIGVYAKQREVEAVAETV
jgi:hypothetical protein